MRSSLRRPAFGSCSTDTSTPSFRYFPSTGGSLTYNKTALWLNTMERWIGWPAMQRVMSAFFQKSAFKHPRPADFFATANAVAGRDLPTLAFYSHVEQDVRERADAAGIDRVVPRSRMAREAAALVESLAP